MTMEENKPDGSRVVAMLEKLMQQQEDILQRFDRVEKHLDSLEKQAAQDKEATQKQLQRQGKQCEIMQATFQQSLTTQIDHILQIQSDGAITTKQVKLLGNQHEQVRTEAKNTKESMATLEAGVNR